MSFDRLLDSVCPHQVVEEALFLNRDRVTVRPLRPISAANSVRVRVNGETYAPSYGVHIGAEALAGKKGPFNIRYNTNDTLLLKVGSGALQTLRIPPGESLSSRDVAQRIAALQPTGATVDLTERGRLRILTQAIGPSATLWLEPSSLATTLGLSTRRQWRGRQTVPGWSLVNDHRTLLERPTRLIVFDAPIRGYLDFVELDYATIREECRRCGGIGIENDWRYAKDGGVIEVRDEDLLIQETQKIAFTIQGTNSFHPWYGTNILNAVGQKNTDNGLYQNFILSDLREAFRRWQAIKRQQEEELGQVVTDGEFPFRLVNVTLVPSPTDRTVVFVNATLQSRSATENLSIERGVRLPGNFALVR